MGLEQFLKGSHSGRSPGQGERARGIHVEPVNHANERASETMPDCQIALDALNQRIAFAEGGRQREDAGGLVNNNDMSIFM